MQACIGGNGAVAGEANVFMRVPDGTAGDTYCATLYALQPVTSASCAGCDVAFDLVEVGAVDVLAGGGSYTCDYLHDVLERSSIGVDYDSGLPRFYGRSDGGDWEQFGFSDTGDLPPPVTVTSVGGATRVDWVWQEYYNSD